MLAYCLIICLAARCMAEHMGGDTATMRYLSAFQYADFAGEGTFLDHYDDTLVIDVNNYCLEASPQIQSRLQALFQAGQPRR